MKHGTAINCIEFTGGNMLKVPPVADPNDNNLNLEVKVYKLNPDGSKGELIRIEPAFPEGRDTPNPRQILPQRPKKEEEKMYPLTEGKSMTKAAEILNVSVSTLAAWLGKEKKPIPYMPVDEPAPPLKMNYDQIINQLTLGFIIEIYASDLDPVDKLGLIAKQIKVWEEL